MKVKKAVRNGDAKLDGLRSRLYGYSDGYNTTDAGIRLCTRAAALTRNKLEQNKKLVYRRPGSIKLDKAIDKDKERFVVL